MSRTSAATAKPATRATVQCDIMSGTTPRRTCGIAYFASSATMRMSACIARVRPIPIAVPVDGRDHRFADLERGRVHRGRGEAAVGRGGERLASAVRSAPAQKAGGAGEDDRADRIVGVEFAVQVTETATHVTGERVARRRPIERENRDAAVDLDQHVVHGVSSRTAATRSAMCPSRIG